MTVGRALAIVAIVAACALSGWIALLARGSIRELTGESLQSILSANATSLEMWLAERQLDAARVARDEEVSAAAKRLLRRGADGRGENPSDSSSAAQLLEDRVGVGGPASGYLGWAVLTLDAKVTASNHANLVGWELPIAADCRERIESVTPTVCRPLRCPVAIASEGAFSRPEAAIMCAMAPITTGGRAEGSLALLIDPLSRFTELLSVARTGNSGETYAFDRNGVLLSQSRFEHQLRAAGLLDSDPLVSSPLNVTLRDPGVDLTRGATIRLPRDPQPLTLMADMATRGGSGVNVTGYNGYRGVSVVGAWRWLPQYGIGVATEMDVAEAYAPMRLLERLLLTMFALVGLTASGFLGLASVFGRLQRRLQRADRAARRLGRYQLIELIGAGGMGSVYRGHHDVLKRDVAIKVLEAASLSPQSVSRFEREVRSTARLRHPNTIAIYDYGRSEDGSFFYVMEYVQGMSIQELVDQFGRQPASRVIHLLLQVCGSISEAHQQGLVHRDVKPANILVTSQTGLYDMVKVLDFGLVKELDRQTVELTQSDAITGTPMYMSPESVRDASTADHRSDLYSIGAVGYTLLTGLPTYEGDASVDICLKQLNEIPERPSERIGVPLPEDLQNVLMSCLRKDPEERPHDVEEFADALRQCRDASHWMAADACRWWAETLDPSGPPEPEADRAATDWRTLKGTPPALGGDWTAAERESERQRLADRESEESAD